MVRSAPSDVSKSAALPAYLVGQTTRRTGSDSFPSVLTGQKPLTYGPCFSEPVPTIRRGSGNVTTLLSITLRLFTVSCPTAVSQSSELGRWTEPLTRESRFDSRLQIQGASLEPRRSDGGRVRTTTDQQGPALSSVPAGAQESRHDESNLQYMRFEAKPLFRTL